MVNQQLKKDYLNKEIGKVHKDDIGGKYYIRNLINEYTYATYIYKKVSDRDKDFNLLHFKIRIK